jgi:phosphatidylserine/phosphatidylglycerophosphate/cardiolipin synthase-like enzyme
MPDAPTILADLSIDELASLADAIQGRWLSLDSSRPAIANLVGGKAESVHRAFAMLKNEGFTAPQGLTLLRGILNAKRSDDAKRTIADLVISGPDVPGIPTAATEAVVQSLFQEAKSEIIAAGYAFHNGQHILERLAKRMAEETHLKVIVHVDISRPYRDTSTNDAVVARFADAFRRKQWPWDPKPQMYYDPRALSKEADVRACLHAKAIIIDQAKLLITSANFTEAAQKRNIETGVLIQSTLRARQLAEYFEGLRANGTLTKLNW